MFLIYFYIGKMQLKILITNLFIFYLYFQSKYQTFEMLENMILIMPHLIFHHLLKLYLVS